MRIKVMNLLIGYRYILPFFVLGYLLIEVIKQNSFMYLPTAILFVYAILELLAKTGMEIGIIPKNE